MSEEMENLHSELFAAAGLESANWRDLRGARGPDAGALAGALDDECFPDDGSAGGATSRGQSSAHPSPHHRAGGGGSGGIAAQPGSQDLAADPSHHGRSLDPGCDQRGGQNFQQRGQGRPSARRTSISYGSCCNASSRSSRLTMRRNRLPRNRRRRASSLKTPAAQQIECADLHAPPCHGRYFSSGGSARCCVSARPVLPAPQRLCPLGRVVDDRLRVVGRRVRRPAPTAGAPPCRRSRAAPARTCGRNRRWGRTSRPGRSG